MYRLTVDDEESESAWDPEAFRAALDSVAGSWADVDEKVIEDLYEWRRTGSQPGLPPSIGIKTK